MDIFTLDGIKLELMIMYRNDKLVIVHDMNNPSAYLVVTAPDGDAPLGDLEDLLDMPHGEHCNFKTPSGSLYHATLIET